MDRPYIRTCKKCGKDFCSADPKAKYHLGCKSPKKNRKSSPLFFEKRIEILIRDNQTCQHCGFDFKSGGKSTQKHAHHIDGDYTNNDINNLVVLCAKCHRLAHREKLEFNFKKDFKPKQYQETYVKPEKFLFKNIG